MSIKKINGVRYLVPWLRISYAISPFFEQLDNCDIGMMKRACRQLEQFEKSGRIDRRKMKSGTRKLVGGLAKAMQEGLDNKKAIRHASRSLREAVERRIGELEADP